MSDVLFYGSSGKYGFLSNFYRHKFIADLPGLLTSAPWATSEHFYQAAKAVSQDDALQVWSCATPSEAKRAGRSIRRRADWESVKEDFMLFALRRKFACPELSDLLVSTSTARLVENAPNDFYWGIGRDGTGANRLGVLLEIVRGERLQLIREGEPII